MRALPLTIPAMRCLSAPSLRAQIPDACKVLPLDEVIRAVGSGYARYPSTDVVSADDYSLCLYKKAAGTTVGLTILEAPEGDGRLPSRCGRRWRGRVAAR